MSKELNKHDKMVVKIAIQEALKLGEKKEDYVQFKIGNKIFRIVRLLNGSVENSI